MRTAGRGGSAPGRLRPLRAPLRGLTGRATLGAALVAAAVATIFSIFLVSVGDLREAARLESRAGEVAAVAARLERSVVDLQTGQRGFVIAGDERFLEPVETAEAEIPVLLDELDRLVLDPAQRQRLDAVGDRIDAYVGFAREVLAAARADPEAAAALIAGGEGRRRVDEIRAAFAAFAQAQRAIAADREERVSAATDRAIWLAAAALAVSLLGIGGLVLAVSRLVVRPVRRLGTAASRIAAGDLTARAGAGFGEVGDLARSFDEMAASLETTRAGLVRSERETVSLLEAAPDALVVVDESGAIVRANARCEQLFGYRSAELLGRRVEELVPARLRERHRAERERYFAAPESRPMGVGLDLVAVASDGRELPVEISLSPLRIEEGLVAIASVRDVTEQREARERIRALNALLEGLVRTAPLAIVQLDPEGVVTGWNPAAEELFGWSEAEAVGSFCPFVPEEEVEEFRGLLARLGRGDSWARSEIRRRRKDGTLLELVASSAPLHDRAGGVVGSFSIIADVTEEKRAQEAVRVLNEELEQFAYVASHDLQEPLRMVVSYCQLLERRYRGRLDEEADEFIRYAVDGATRMQTLISDLLAYSRAGREQRRLEPVPLEEPLDRALAALEATLAEAGAVVTRDPLPTVLGDPAQLAQLFQNLVGNAVKYRGEQPPRVHVGAEREDPSRWVVSVRDNGIGIDPAYAERVFEVFERLHGRDAYPGTGIGLAICRRIVERHGGRIWVVSRPGEGSDFSFTLSAVEDEGER